MTRILYARYRSSRELQFPKYEYKTRFGYSFFEILSTTKHVQSSWLRSSAELKLKLESIMKAESRIWLLVIALETNMKFKLSDLDINCHKIQLPCFVWWKWQCNCANKQYWKCGLWIQKFESPLRTTVIEQSKSRNRRIYWEIIKLNQSWVNKFRNKRSGMDFFFWYLDLVQIGNCGSSIQMDL